MSLNNPKYVRVDDELFELNTDFRVAIECDKIARDKTIGDYERALAFVYKLYGEKGLNSKHINKLFELGIKYIGFNKKNDDDEVEKKEEKFKLDYEKCEGLIKSSFKFDYNYDPYNLEYLHWYDFYNDLANLSTSEFGHCCILNRVVSTLNEDVNEIKDDKLRNKIIDAQKALQKKYCIYEEKQMTKEQEKSANEFYKLLGIEN